MVWEHDDWPMANELFPVKPFFGKNPLGFHWSSGWNKVCDRLSFVRYLANGRLCPVIFFMKCLTISNPIESHSKPLFSWGFRTMFLGIFQRWENPFLTAETSPDPFRQLKTSEDFAESAFGSRTASGQPGRPHPFWENEYDAWKLGYTAKRMG